MLHTNHFIHGQCTWMHVIQRCLSHPHEPRRCDKCLLSVFQQALLSWWVGLTTSDIHQCTINLWTTHSPPMTIPPPKTMRLSFTLQLGFHMGMRRVMQVKNAPVPINTIPTCKQFGKKPVGCQEPAVFSYQDHKIVMLNVSSFSS